MTVMPPALDKALRSFYESEEKIRRLDKPLEFKETYEVSNALAERQRAIRRLYEETKKQYP